MVSIDPLQEMVTILTTNWTPANTGSRTPTIFKVIDKKSLRLSTGDFIAIYGDEKKGPAGIGSGRHADRAFIKIDIRTALTEAQARLILDEVRRICNNNLVNPTANYSRLDPDFDETNLSDKTRKIYRFVKDVQMFIYGRDRST